MIKLLGFTHILETLIILAALISFPALTVEESRALEKNQYTIYLDNKTDLKLEVKIATDPHTVKRAYTFPPRTKYAQGFPIEPGKYFIFVQSTKCPFLKYQTVTWASASQTYKSLVVSEASFAPKTVPEYCKQLVVSSEYQGTWICQDRGWLKLYQENRSEGIIITGTFGGNEREAWGRNNVKGGTVEGRVDGDVMFITFNNQDGTYTKAEVSQGLDPYSFSGTWRWFNNNGSYKGSGTWGCRRGKNE